MAQRTGRQYLPTALERGGYYHSSNVYPDSVFTYLRQFLDQYPKSKAGLRLMSNYYMSAGAVDRGFQVFERLISYYPDDFSLYFECGRANYLFYLNTGDDRFRRESEKYFNLATNRNKFIRADIEAARESLRSLTGK